MQGVGTNTVRNIASSIRTTCTNLGNKFDQYAVKVYDIVVAYNNAKAHDGEVFYTPDAYKIGITGSINNIGILPHQLQKLQNSLSHSLARIESLMDEVIVSCNKIEGKEKEIEHLLNDDEEENNDSFSLPNLDDIDWDDPKAVNEAMRLGTKPASIYSDPEACQEILNYYKKIQSQYAKNTNILKDSDTFQEWRSIGIGLESIISFWQLRKKDSYKLQAKKGVEEQVKKIKESVTLGEEPKIDYKDPASLQKGIDYYEKLIEELGHQWSAAFDAIANNPVAKPEEIAKEQELKRQILSYQSIIQFYKIRINEAKSKA